MCLQEIIPPIVSEIYLQSLSQVLSSLSFVDTIESYNL